MTTSENTEGESLTGSNNESDHKDENAISEVANIDNEGEDWGNEAANIDNEGEDWGPADNGVVDNSGEDWSKPEPTNEPTRSRPTYEPTDDPTIDLLSRLEDLKGTMFCKC